MQDHLKYLVVDDVTDWADELSQAVESYFVDERRFAKARVRGFTAYNATQADSQIAAGGWDLVLLDMNLGDGSGRKGARERISGLDLLGDIARGNRAYFVIIVTGAVTDPDLEKFYGRDTAALLRFGAMNEAVKRMPASRIRILHKPDAKSVCEAVEILRQQIHSALDQYCSVSLERNMFRALPGDPDLLEICFNGGPRLTVPFEAPFRTIQSALAQPNRMLKVTELIQRLAHTSGKSGAVVLPDADAAMPKKRALESEYRGHQDDEVSSADGLDWEEMDGFGVSGALHEPADTSEGTIPVETLIGGLLVASQRGLDLGEAVKGIVTGMGVDEAVLLSIPRVAAEWARDGQAASAEFGIEHASEALSNLIRELKPLLKPIKQRWLEKKRAPKGDAPKRGKEAVRVTVAADTREMELARQHWKRFKAKTKARPALAAFYDHIIAWIPRDPTARGHLYYRPPGGGEFCPFWLTE
jgi:CheY-like chemotaxis protein